MALARSASGPGGLSINTGAANLFGSSTSQPAAPGAGLFGSTTQTTQAAPSGGLFGNASSQPAQQQTGGSLFGNAAAPQPQQQQTTSLFGSSTAAASQPQQSGGPFGGAASTQAKPAGGLFGTATAAQQPQQGGGMFGTNTANQQQGLFGSATQQQQQPQQATGGFFGNSASGSLFGKPQQQATSTGSGLFGQSQPAGNSVLGGNPSASIGPGLTMGQSTNAQQQQQQQQQVVPGVRIDVSNIKPTTRFNDLQEELQNRITSLDNFIQNCIHQKQQVDAFMPAHGAQLEAIPADVKFVARKYDGVAQALAADAQGISGLRDLVKVDADHARMSFRAVENLKLPAQYHTSGLWAARQQQQESAAAVAASAGGGGDGAGDSSDVIDFFSRTAEEMDEQLRRFTSNLGEIEMHMHGVQANVMEQLQRVSSSGQGGAQGGGGGGGGSADSKVAELAAVLRDFEESILKVAGVIGGSREEMTELQLGGFTSNGTNGHR